MVGSRIKLVVVDVAVSKRDFKLIKKEKKNRSDVMLCRVVIAKKLRGKMKEIKEISI